MKHCAKKLLPILSVAFALQACESTTVKAVGDYCWKSKPLHCREADTDETCAEIDGHNAVYDKECVDDTMLEDMEDEALGDMTSF